MKRPAPLRMRAVIVRSQRSEWIHPDTIRRARREAWKSMLGFFMPEAHQALEELRRQGRYRLTRVVVTEAA